MSVSINGTNGLVFNDNSSQNTAASGFGFKNRIINGDFRIDQRNAGASTTPTNGLYTLDRWQVEASQTSKFSIQQNAGSVAPPAGFSTYLGVTSLSSYTVGSSENFLIRQPFEGFNTADFSFGTAGASTVTISFWVRSSLTGTFGGSLKNDSSTRSYPFSYTISAANTWEQKSVTIAGDTTGTWPAAVNTRSMTLSFSLGVGSSLSGTAGSWAGANYVSATGATSVVGTNGATFYITGVQLEKGSTATSFDYRPYGTELNLCQRYFEQWNAGSAYGVMPTAQIGYGNQFNASLLPFVFKRTTPSVTLSTTNGGNLFSAYGTNASGSSFPWSASLSVDTGMTGNLGVDIYAVLSSSGSGGAGTCVNLLLRANQYIQFSAEL